MTEMMNHLELTAWTAGNGEIFSIDFRLTAEQVALMPKSYRVRVGQNRAAVGDQLANAGEKNEAAISRMRKIITKVREAGGQVTANTRVHNGASMDEINAFVGC